MGGIGSGRRYQGGRGTTNDYQSLDVRRLHREGLLAPGLAFNWTWTSDGERLASILIRTEAGKVTLSYRHQRAGHGWQPMEYAVPLDWTACNYGGSRPWFLCPAIGCGRRVAKLYLGGSDFFACRHCYRLAYDCQRETDDDRAMRRAETIRRRLGWEPGVLNLVGRRPKGMHQHTFERLQGQLDLFVRASIAGMASRLRLTEKGLGGLLDDLDIDW